MYLPESVGEVEEYLERRCIMGIVKRADQIAVGEYGKHLSQLNKQAATEMVRLALIEIEAEDHNKKFRI